MKLDTESKSTLDLIMRTYHLLSEDLSDKDTAELANPDLAPKVSANVIPLPTGLERLPPKNWQEVEARLANTLSRISSDTGRGTGSCNVKDENPTNYYLGVIWGISGENLPNGRRMAQDLSLIHI